METRSNHVLVGAVVLMLLALLAVFTVWIARLGGQSEKEYDIFFGDAVDGLARGSGVTFAGVPSGQVTEIALFRPDPEYVRVRIRVNEDTPILQGTTATISSVGFTGVSQIALDGARKGARAIACPDEGGSRVCPYGVPVIPTRVGGFGAILNSAPQLLERLSTLTDRLTGLLTDKNQASVQGILENTSRLTDAFADRAPEIAQTLSQTRIAIAQAGNAAEQVGALAARADGVLGNDVQPTIANLNRTIDSARQSAEALEGAIGGARPGLEAFSKRTVPEVNLLVRDLRRTSDALASVAEKVDQGGATSIIGSPKLPDYKGK